jgi:predicted nucleic acid-binding protein
LKAFFDTNILVYSFSEDEKRPVALAALADGGVISVQVLNELTNVLRKKQKRDWPTIESALSVLKLRFPDIVPLTAQLHEASLPLARDHGLTIYDALIIAAAMEAGCDTLFSEDLQHGRVFGRVTIQNPFLGAV